MAQKSNPTSLRLEKTNQHWADIWYGDYYYTTQYLQTAQISAYVKNVSSQGKFAPPVVFLTRERQQVQMALFYPKKPPSRVARTGKRASERNRPPFRRDDRLRKIFRWSGGDHRGGAPIHASNCHINALPEKGGEVPRFIQKVDGYINGGGKEGGAHFQPFWGKQHSVNILGNSAIQDWFTRDSFLPQSEKSSQFPSGSMQQRSAHNPPTQAEISGVPLAPPKCALRYLLLHFFATYSSSITTPGVPNRGMPPFLGGVLDQQSPHSSPGDAGDPEGDKPHNSVDNSPGCGELVIPDQGVNNSCAEVRHPRALNFSLAFKTTPSGGEKGGGAPKIAVNTPLGSLHDMRGNVDTLAARPPRYKGSTLFQNHLEWCIHRQLRTPCKIHFFLVHSHQHHPLFLASHIVYLLQEKMPFRRLKDQIIRDVKKRGGIRGIRITCSGRVASRSKKAQKAKRESIQWGETGLHVFSSLLSFASKSALTSFGKIGVKVWICYG